MKKNNTISLQSLGAAETVTGSKHLLRTPGLNILVDCGLFQGIKSLRIKNWQEFPLDPSEIDVLLLTHAHLDHCGYIPLFVKNGFRGKIYMTEPTRDLATIILMDSAKIQQEDAARANAKGYSKHHPARPLYTTEDVQFAIKCFMTAEHGIRTELSPELSFCFRKNGHILGSVAIELSCYGKTIIFSGDIGRYSSILMEPPLKLQGADFIVMESTYGDRLHSDKNPAVQLAEVINETIMRHGNVLIPSFAVGRAQEIILVLNELKDSKMIPSGIPVYLDSPMAADATEILYKYPDWIKAMPAQYMQVGKGVTINRDFHNTKNIIADVNSKIVISASGMLTGGRVLEYIKHYITEESNTILLAGFQAEGTRGRALINGAHEIKIHGRYYPVKASITEIPGLSAHADQAELIQWLRNMRHLPEKIFLVHGEPSALEALRVKIKDEFNIPVIIQQKDALSALFNKPEYANSIKQ